MTGWSDFFIATVGAAAALAGTLLVAMSINITRIVSQPTLPGRAANTLLIVGTALIVSAVALMPVSLANFGEATTAFGAMLLASSAHATLIVARHRATGPAPGRIIFGMAGPVLAPLPYIVGGIILAVGGSNGLIFIAVGVLIGLAVSLLNSWILLVEILR